MNETSRPPTLLIVDDNPVVLTAQVDLFRAAGFEVVEARTGEEGWERARSAPPDLALLDVQLPDLHGVELCRRLKSDPQTCHVFVVMLSSLETSPGRQAAGLEAGADGYIARPVDPRELLARVQAMGRLQRAEAGLRRAHEQLEERVLKRTAELAAANGELRALSLRLLDVQEAERRFLARELHDEFGQQLTALKMVLDQAVIRASAENAAPLQQAVGLTQEIVTRVRQLSLTLRPPLLDDLGLVVALGWHTRRFAEQTGLAIEFRHADVSERLPAPVETALYRIVQEALTNVVRHARARGAVVRFWVDAENAGVQVEDDGCGFDANASRAGVSSGLAGMRERAELLGGQFCLESTPGTGTRVTVEVPRNAGTTAANPGAEP